MTKGYRQSPEHVAKRIKSGPDHHRWAGDAISERGGRSRALRMYPPGSCVTCGASKAERHHVDGNTANNQPSNIKMVCRLCHMTEDGRLSAFVTAANRNAPTLIQAAAVARRARTTCKRDHPLTGLNLYVTPKGRRVCKACRKLAKRSYLSRKAAK